MVYSQAGELSAYLSTCLSIFSIMCMVGVVARTLSTMLEELTGARIHHTVLEVFGLTPFLDSYPDLLAGTLVLLPAVILAIGVKVGWCHLTYFIIMNWLLWLYNFILLDRLPKLYN